MHDLKKRGTNERTKEERSERQNKTTISEKEEEEEKNTNEERCMYHIRQAQQNLGRKSVQTERNP